ncbi:hypothetical protein [Methyloceanibacter caenitepidi]|uniref:Uncharacterized protein n=1 Tax=Methyloceanibacter caenitepidi TaxID=1384459 RepID=A0A0A8K4L5_9HYPH|nr:hypothetical protein [Methyloceanibacter caenitepidi]BAQ16934.1 hypothetical protein GL4_1478 [Methyloceanibacter caenitepidi]
MNRKYISAEDFAAWVENVAGSDRKAAAMLSLARDTVAKYRDEGAPLYIGLACAALYHRLDPFSASALK